MSSDSSDSTPLPPGAGDGSHAITAAAGDRIGRYTLLALLGRGGFGEVWRAATPQGSEVALKLLFPLGTAQRQRVVQEIAVLEMLRLDGVVRLLDHGEIGERSFLVMDVIEGAPFGRGDWPEVRACALPLLETLARVHDAGVVHRDLKPSNILVTGDGRPVILDFGLARLSSSVNQLTVVGQALGTPPFASPEQLQGKPADHRSDIYSLGLMLYEALAGHPPHRTEDPALLLHDRLVAETPALGALVPASLRGDAEIVMTMLARDASARPDAREVLGALRGVPVPATLRLPRLGDPELVARVAARVRAGELVFVAGPPGSGRTQLLQDVAELLEDQVVWATRERRPYASLVSAIGRPPEDCPGDQVQPWVDDALRRLDRPLLADQPERLDAWSRAALHAVRLPVGGVLAEDGPGAVHLEPFPVVALRALFVGPDRVLHLREDAAIELHRRTGGLARRVAEQLKVWLRDGVASREGDHFRIGRDALDRLREEVVGTAGVPRGARLPRHQDELLAAVQFCAPNATPAALAEILRWPRWEVDLELAALAEAGLVAGEDGRWTPLQEASAHWTAGQAAAAHRALAALLPPGAPGRLRHLIDAGAEGIDDEVLAVVAAFQEQGRPSRSVAVLQGALTLRPRSRPLLAALTTTLIDLLQTDAMEGASVLALAAGEQDMADLLDAAHKAYRGQERDAAALLDTLPPFADPTVEMRRLAVRVRASWREPFEAQEALLERLRGSAAVQASEEHLAWWEGWLGLLRFQQRRYREAAGLHERAAARRGPIGRMNALQNAARAWLMAGEAGRVSSIAQELGALARERRLTLMEATAERLMRAAAKLRGETTPDLELVACARLLDDPLLHGDIALTESFIAFQGRHLAGATLAEEAEQALARAGNAVAAKYAAAVRFAVTGQGDAAGLLAWARALRAHPDVALDALGLLASGGAHIALSIEERNWLSQSQLEETAPYKVGAIAASEALVLLGLREVPMSNTPSVFSRIPSPTSLSLTADPWWEARQPQVFGKRPNAFTPSYYPGTTSIELGGVKIGSVYVAEQPEPDLSAMGATLMATTPTVFRTEDVFLTRGDVNTLPMDHGPGAPVAASGAAQTSASRAQFLAGLQQQLPLPGGAAARLASSIIHCYEITSVEDLVNSLDQSEASLRLSRLVDLKGQGPDGYVYALPKTSSAPYWRRTLYQLYAPNLPLPPQGKVQLEYDSNPEGLNLRRLVQIRAQPGWRLDVCSIHGRVVFNPEDLNDAPLPAAPLPLTAGVRRLP